MMHIMYSCSEQYKSNAVTENKSHGGTPFLAGLRSTVGFHLFAIIVRPCDTDKPNLLSNHHAIMPAGAVDDLNIAALIPAANNPHMAVLGVEHQLPRLGLVPRNGVQYPCSVSGVWLPSDILAVPFAGCFLRSDSHLNFNTHQIRAKFY